MRLYSILCADVAFIVTRISERPDVQDKWFNARIKLIKGTMHDAGFGNNGTYIN